MSIQRISQNFEIMCWDIIIPLIEDKGPLMRMIAAIKSFARTKSGLLTLLIFVWAAVGFVFGLVFGRVIWMLQFL